MLTCSSSHFPDLRLYKRFCTLRHQLDHKYGHPIPAAIGSKGQTKAAYRFFNNERVKSSQLIGAQYAELEPSLSKENTPVLCLSDTTELDYTRKKGAEAVGPLTYKLRRGMLAHTSMLVNEQGQPLGLLNQDFIVRKEDHFGKSEERRHWPIERKESYRWLADFEQMQSCSRLLKRPMIFVADREADIMDIYYARNYSQAHFVIRSQFNRCTTEANTHLYQLLEQQDFVHTFEADITHAKARKKRTAVLSLRFIPVEIKLNKSRGRLRNKKHLAPVSMFAVEVCECHPPADIEEPVRWILLTSLPVQQIEDALTIIKIYLKRWIIERFFYLLKSGGAAVEELQLGSATALKIAVTIYSIVIMDAMKIKYAAKQQPDLPIAELGISNQIGQVLYQYVSRYNGTPVVFDPENPPTAWEFCRVLGRLGGFIPSKERPLPGLKIITRALEQLATIMSVYEMLKPKDE